MRKRLRDTKPKQSDPNQTHDREVVLMASIKDIAKACGVSVATVSKALNGHNDISQATKEKVREAARQLGYMPNSAARALKTNRTYNLGVLFVDEAQSGLTHEFFAAVLDSFIRKNRYNKSNVQRERSYARAI